ncbi:MAG: alpha/beta hydrolase, partial [Acidimicrobiia bacterium]
MPDISSPLADTEVHALHSAATDGAFKIFVGHCDTRSRKAVSTLYLTDANGLFGAAVDAIRLMQLAQHLPPMLVVGIGYPVGALAEATARRTKDLSPSDDDKYAHLFPERPEMGGAPALLEFIRAELIPWVEASYNVEPGDATFFGHSLAGLFGTYALLTQPDTFRRYAIGSPSLWWNDGIATSIEQAYADAHDDLAA